VQGRWIQDRSLSVAVLEGYRNLLMHGEYPTAVVRITMPPTDVDVNVHPTKAQVKFHNPQKIFRVVAHTVRTVLEKAPWLVEERTSSPSLPEFTNSETAEESNHRFVGAEFTRVQYSGKIFPLTEVRASLASFSSPEAPATVSSPDVFKWADLQVIGQLNHTYIVAQSQNSFYLIDQHASHERVVFEQLRRSFAAGRMEMQELLIPLLFDFNAVEIEALLLQREAIEKLGVRIERMGPESLGVQAIPSLIKESAVAAALKSLAHSLVDTLQSSALESAFMDVFATMACHTVVRAGQSLSLEQMHLILQQMDEFPLSSFCPHGRPVSIRRKFSEIDREFGRIV
jgi:DNA mismatch repair protein MutL